MAELWEYNLEIDTAKSFQAFCIYRDLGPNRTIDHAFCVYSKRPLSAKRAPGHFDKWSIKGKWVDRSKAYDLNQEQLRRAESSLESRQKHEDRLEEVRSITEALALTRLKSSLRSAVLVRDTIAWLEKECKQGDRSILNEKQADFLLTLVSIQNKDAATIETSLKLADESLGIKDLIDRLRGD
jgi:hypothetical protein